MPKSGPKPKNLAQRMNALLGSATEADLAAFDAEIASAEARVKALKAAREIVAEEVLNREDEPVQAQPSNGPAKPVKRVEKAYQTIDHLTKVVAEYLIENGPCMARKMVSQLKVTDVNLQHVLDQSELFERDGPNTWTMTNKCRQKYDAKTKQDD